MDSPYIIIEPTDKAIKIVVGSIIDKKPVILYATKFDNKTPMIENGIIIDIKSLSNFFKQISHVEDREMKVKFDIRNAYVILPPIGFEVYEVKQGTTVISTDGRISKLDIDNAINMINNFITVRIKKGNIIVDNIPKMYYVDRGRSDKAPIGYRSSMISVKSLIYTLPEKLSTGYEKSLGFAGINDKKKYRRSIRYC